ncbi:hypothetical protein EBB79_01325 [Parasedimentitalea marina]|uniref:Uncharacterized protein n=1 Tax=Parasedimentitalea marina TaxID=2483033 RepID=A0A3T0MY41_9RHOB|nr:hypothetical protein [Parasedimentitalea marina]AZV76669.1 hypothetical protein EBB79_01325 [Parasedimentitalea marina]
MDLDAYDEFVSCTNSGLKANAREAVLRFVNSFSCIPEREEWVRSFLNEKAQVQGNGAIRHEIYAYIVFPVLKAGFDQDDPWALMWLAKTRNNFSSVKTLSDQLKGVTPLELLLRAFKIEPEMPELKAKLLAHLVSGFEYAGHEWPSGLLIAPGLAGVNEEQELVELAMSLDVSGDNTSGLRDYQGKLDEQLSRLKR